MSPSEIIAFELLLKVYAPSADPDTAMPLYRLFGLMAKGRGVVSKLVVHLLGNQVHIDYKTDYIAVRRSWTTLDDAMSKFVDSRRF
jgi:hypothetical protein